MSTKLTESAAHGMCDMMYCQIFVACNWPCICHVANYLEGHVAPMSCMAIYTHRMQTRRNIVISLKHLAWPAAETCKLIDLSKECHDTETYRTSVRRGWQRFLSLAQALPNTCCTSSIWCPCHSPSYSLHHTDMLQQLPSLISASFPWIKECRRKVKLREAEQVVFQQLSFQKWQLVIEFEISLLAFDEVLTGILKFEFKIWTWIWTWPWPYTYLFQSQSQSQRCVPSWSHSRFQSRFKRKYSSCFFYVWVWLFGEVWKKATNHFQL